jgi:hypothetical protein
MPAMNSIERADGENSGTLEVNRVDVADDLHIRFMIYGSRFMIGNGMERAAYPKSEIRNP